MISVEMQRALEHVAAAYEALAHASESALHASMWLVEHVDSISLAPGASLGTQFHRPQITAAAPAWWYVYS